MPPDDDADCADALEKFFHEMGAEAITQPKLSVTATSLPAETTIVLLESRGSRSDRHRSPATRASGRSRTTRPRLMTVRVRSAAGQ
jgi:hypothetical protein